MEYYKLNTSHVAVDTLMRGGISLAWRNELLYRHKADESIDIHKLVADLATGYGMDECEVDDAYDWLITHLEIAIRIKGDTATVWRNPEIYPEAVATSIERFLLPTGRKFTLINGCPWLLVDPVPTAPDSARLVHTDKVYLSHATAFMPRVCADKARLCSSAAFLGLYSVKEVYDDTRYGATIELYATDKLPPPVVYSQSGRTTVRYRYHTT